jgi:hypothetical protein
MDWIFKMLLDYYSLKKGGYFARKGIDMEF